MSAIKSTESTQTSSIQKFQPGNHPPGREKSAWRVMRRRCLDPNFKDFPRYGGAGIRVCPQWIASFPQFLADVGTSPTREHWLCRLDTLGHYMPDNVIWSTRDEQQRRRQFCQIVTIKGKAMTAAEAGRLEGMPTRNTVIRRWKEGFSPAQPRGMKLYARSMWITYQGETLPVPAWAKRLGLPHSRLWSRIKRGMPLDQAMTPTRYRTRPGTTNKSPTASASTERNSK